MKMHESQGQDSTSSAATNSSSGSVNDSSLKRNNLHRRAGENDRSPSPRMHHHSQRRRRSSRDSINTHLHLQQQQQQQQQLPNNHSSMNTTTTTDSCSESPPSFENLAPMKAALTRMHHPQVQSGPPATSTDWPLHMHTMSAYHHPHVYHPHHAAALQQHYYHRQTGLNFWLILINILCICVHVFACVCVCVLHCLNFFLSLFSFFFFSLLFVCFHFKTRIFGLLSHGRRTTICFLFFDNIQTWVGKVRVIIVRFIWH